MAEVRMIGLKLKTSGMPSHLPAHIESRIDKAIMARRFAVGMDYDRTMVNTDETRRIFPPLADDVSGVINPTGALCMLGIPLAIFSGNKPSYLHSLGVEGLKSWLRARGKLEAIRNFFVYSQNSTWLTQFDGFGNEIEKTSEEYAKKYLFPPQHIQTIEDVFRQAIDRVAHSKGVRFMMEIPMPIRPEGSREEHRAYGPIFENRNNVQLSWIAIPSELRTDIINKALSQLHYDMKDLYRIEPGGQFSIDINHRMVAKNNGTLHFRQTQFKNDADSSLLLYFGDSVYKKPDHDGNDLPVINDPNSIVFAVNPDQSTVPEHDRIIKAGPGPDSTKAWLTWLLMKYSSLRFASKDITQEEKLDILQAITASGLVEGIDLPQ